MSVLPIGISGEEAGDFLIERSLRFNSADSAYLNRTPASTTSGTKATFSFWVKPSQTVNGTTNPGVIVGRTSGYAFIQFWDQNNNGNPVLYMGNTSVYMNTASVFRDYSAWYHIVCILDTTQATDSNRLQIWVNGVRQAAGGFTTWPSLNSTQEFLNSSSATYYLGQRGAGDGYLNGYLTEVHFVDGQALTPSDFGEYNTDTGVWQPIKYTGTYGTNGFYLNFADNSSTTALGYDAAGSNDWTPNNFSVTAGAENDSLVDSPQCYGDDTGVGGEVRGNYATWNPIHKIVNYGHSTITNGNLYAVKGLHTAAYGSMAMSTGKWYWEVTVEAGNQMIGMIGTNSTGDGASGYSYNDSKVYGVYPWSDIIFAGNFNSGGSGSTGGVISFTTSVKTLMFAYDADSRKFWFGVDGTWIGNPAAGTGNSLTTASTIPSFVPWVHSAATTQNNNATANFGQRPFAYTAPSGFKALCTTNLPEPAIVDGGEYFNASLYSGDSVNVSITGLAYQPDFVWIKSRSNAVAHVLFDVLRGDSYRLQSSTTDTETYNANSISFNIDGFTAKVGGSSRWNTSGATYVAWNWKANGSGVTNTAGSVTSTVSVNTTSGFSIAIFDPPSSGSFSFGHGLGITPDFMIIKERDGAGNNWIVWHNYWGAPTNHGLYLNTLNGQFSSGSNWLTGLSSSTASITQGQVTGGDYNWVVYSFVGVPGFSSFGTYVGNGSSDGPFINCGFRPRFFLLKRFDSGSAANWEIYDTSRDTYNIADRRLSPSLADAEDRTFALGDMLSNGVKIRQTDQTWNASGGTYIYAAFAETPFKYALAR